MRIAITGATGFVGHAIACAMAADGHEVVVVSRSPDAARELTPIPVADVVVWDPAAGTIDGTALEGCDAVVHLAGESIAGIWTEAKRRRIRESRVRGTELIARTVAALDRKPAAFLSASAAGYYGDRPPVEPIDEACSPGTGFLADTVVAWEAATRPAEEAGIRVARMRFGLVLGREGGLLAAMLPLFRLGLGGRLGSGRQMMSWVALDEIPGVVRHILDRDTLAGPINVVAPEAVSNAAFTETLGRILHRPTPFHVPAFALRLAPGGMAEEMLLGGARIVPGRLLESGYRFAWPELEPALRHALVASG